MLKQLPSKFTIMRSHVLDALGNERKIIFVDETIFTTATVLTHAYSSKGTNAQIDQSLMNNEALEVVGGVSCDGLEGYLVKKQAIDSESFISFLTVMMKNNPQTRLAVFMDARFHLSKRVSAFLWIITINPFKIFLTARNTTLLSGCGPL